MSFSNVGMMDRLLALARKRAQNQAAPSPQANSSAAAAAKAIRRRDALFSDYAQVATLKQRSGLSVDTPENWKRLWQENPALRLARTPLPMGWVTEDEDGAVVGYMGSIPLLYQYAEQTLLAATTTCYAVDPPYRARSLGLVGSFFRQPGVDLYLDTTATPAAAKIMQSFKAVALPQRDYGKVLFWILKPREFLRAAMEKLQVPRRWGALAASLAAPVVSADIALRGRNPIRGGFRRSCRELKIEEIGDDFQDLWQRKLRERPRLLAWRTPEILRWHFQVPGSRRRNHVLGCYREGRLEGYAIVQTHISAHFGLQKAILADLIAADDQPEVIAELWRGTVEMAASNQSDIFEVLGFPEVVRSVGGNWKPYIRHYPACPFYYKSACAAVDGALAKEESWYATPFDGDTTLSP